MNLPIINAYKTFCQRASDHIRETFDANRIIIQVGSATCEHAAGSLAVADEFRKHIAASGQTHIVLRQTGCTGRCSREPIVGVLLPGQMPVTYERVDRGLVHEIFTSHILQGNVLRNHVLDGPLPDAVEHELVCCGNSRCAGPGKDLFNGTLQQHLRDAGVDVGRLRIVNASCFGACVAESMGQFAHILMRPEKILYRIANEADLKDVITTHLLGGQVVERLRVKEDTVNQEFFDLYGDVAFFNRQSRVALRHNGIIDPTSIDDYIRFRGFEALANVLERGEPDAVIAEVTRSKLRGRGGGGYPTGQKWAMGAAAEVTPRYLICNADEGDPGAFMDRSMLESDPFNVIEGMLIAGYAVGCERGFFYIRAEYPLAIERIENAIRQCRQYGVLGPHIFSSGFSFDLEIRLGAGAFVCGEETALIHSIEGERGQPRIRPPYPTAVGLWGKPTVINNVETFANVPAILLFGADWFSRIGTPESGGTKVFALAGKVTHTGLVEVPMGTSLGHIVNQIGGGVADGKRLKAIQTGGPAGGCLPAEMEHLAVDFDSLTHAGSIMGSGGMIVLDEDDCMVDIAKFFIAFSQDESCGKCTPCREGTMRMLEILERITAGNGTPADLDKLDRLGRLVKKTSLCGLGRACANPVLSTMEHFREEYIAHVTQKRCPARRCVALLHYEIDAEACTGCTLCARQCPVNCIAGSRRELHVIDSSRCIKCGRCFQVCHFDAVRRT